MYYLHAVIDCTPLLIKFKTEKALKKYIKSFKLNDDNSVDYYFKANSKELFLIDEHYLNSLEEHK